jgi:hypothetical protein
MYISCPETLIQFTICIGNYETENLWAGGRRGGIPSLRIALTCGGDITLHTTSTSSNWLFT